MAEIGEFQPFIFLFSCLKKYVHMNKKIKKYRVNLNSETYAISMVECPAIDENFVALSKEEEEQVMLESDEKHMVYGAVLVPDRDILRKATDVLDKHYISFSSDSIEKMSQDFMKEYRQHEVKVAHKDIANEVCVVESWLKSDIYKDKSVALGLNPNLPIGTWFVGMKVNNIDTWKKIKSGELKGFSVESILHYENFEKENFENNMVETNEMFWDKLKNTLKEAFGEKKGEDNIEPIAIEDLAAASGFTNVEDYEKEKAAVIAELEEQKAGEEKPVEEAPKAEEKPAEEVEETPKVEDKPAEETPKVEEEKPEETAITPDIAKLEELIGNLKNEINALKTMNSGLEEKVKEMSKEPSAKPIPTHSKASAGDTYKNWREQMRTMIG